MHTEAMRNLPSPEAGFIFCEDEKIGFFSPNELDSELFTEI